MSWIGKTKGEKDGEEASQKKPLSYTVAAKMAHEEFKEATGLMHQFVKEGLKKLHEREPGKYSLSDRDDTGEFVPKLKRYARIKMRVPGEDEADALIVLMRHALSLGPGEPCPLKKQPGTTMRDDKLTYKVFLKTNALEKWNPEAKDTKTLNAKNCGIVLKAALKDLNVIPDGEKNYYPPMDTEEVEEAARALRVQRKREEEEEEKGGAAR